MNEHSYFYIFAVVNNAANNANEILHTSLPLVFPTEYDVGCDFS
jgi:hypothetical protein